jgi:hypothetical protein
MRVKKASLGIEPPKIKMILLDFDFVVTGFNLHTHNSLVKCGFSPKVNGLGKIVNGQLIDNRNENDDYDKEVVEDWASENLIYNCLRDPEGVINIIRHAFDQDIHVAIVSFNKFPDVIPFALEIIGFVDAEIEKIDIICGSPLETGVGKNEHINLAAERKGIKNLENVLFVDDNAINCLKAKSIGAMSVWAGREMDFVKSMGNVLNISIVRDFGSSGYSDDEMDIDDCNIDILGNN